MARSAAGAREKFKVFKFFQRVIVSGKGSCSVGIRNSTRSRERETKRRICEAWGQCEKENFSEIQWRTVSRRKP